MLTPAQVIPFLSHDDPEVRRRARLYLTSAHDPAPATADDFWAAADKAPPEEAGAYLDRLGLVPQTENSLRRLLDELPKADPATADSLRRTLERVEFDLLRQHVDTIRASTAVPEALTQHLRARLDLANEPVEPLWDRMLAFGRGLGDRNLTEAEELEADRLIEAVARHPDAFRERVVAALRDPELTAWAELLVTDIAGQMKLTDAVGPLLDKLKAEDAELLWEVAGDALVHIGDEGVVRQIAERWPAEDAGFRISATGILGRIKRPESQAVLLERLQAEADPDMVSTLVAAVADLIPDDEPTFATLRGIARDGNYDRTDIRLDEELLTLAVMNGLPLPEAGQWRERMEQGRSRWAMGMSNVDQLLQPAGSLGPATLHTPPLRPMGGGGIGGGGAAARRGGSAAALAERPKAAPAATVRQPFRNAQAKVGRNDPCTCGSGKKFKKCCGK